MLSPTQILEQMLRHIAKFDGAHVEDSIDQAILRTEANTIFRILRVIEESSKQRFIVTASGAYLDVIGGGMDMPRYPGEDDTSYRSRLAFNEHTWNDCTLSGIKGMIKHYYGINVDPDVTSGANMKNLPRYENESDADYLERLEFYDKNIVMELYKQAACFYNKDRSTESPWSDHEGWIHPSSDFGAEWLSPVTTPGAFEVHLAAFQSGEEYLIKKRHLHQKLMAIRAAGVVVLLYFHLDFKADKMLTPEAKLSEIELINQAKMESPNVYENYDVTINNGVVTSIVADIKDKLSGCVSRRIVHDRQKNKCRDDYVEDLKLTTDPYKLIELEHGSLARRSEPFRFRKSKLRNDCWKFFYGVKYEEVNISVDSKIRIPIKATIPQNLGLQEDRRTVAEFVVNDSSIEYLIFEVTGKRGDRTITITSAYDSEKYDHIAVASDLQEKLAGSRFGSIQLSTGFMASALIDDAYAQEYRRKVKYNTYYARKSPMIDDSHFYRGEDLHGLQFYPVLDYVDFWWRVSTVNDGKISSPTAPQKLTIARIKDGFSRFWWKVTTFDGRIIHSPANELPLELVGMPSLPNQDVALKSAKTWYASFKHVDPVRICKSDADVVVLERYNPASNRLWSRSDIVSFRLSSSDKDKIMLARIPFCGISLNDPLLFTVPSVLLGNVSGEAVPVRYWLDDWMEFLKKTIDDAIDCGFNGIYLDYVNIWASWVADFPDAENRAKDAIVAVSNYVHVVRAKKGFLMVTHGQDNWVSDQKYMKAIDGIACDGVMYNGNDVTDQADSATVINNLNTCINNGKVAMVMDYIVDMSNRMNFVNYTSLLGFIPCAIDKPLSDI
jgi:endo-alpha-1,4-polygalactosaminidase (GH114 family)